MFSKKLKSLKPNGPGPMNSLNSTGTKSNTKSYNRNLTKEPGFQGKQLAGKSGRELIELEQPSEMSITNIPVPSTTILTADLHGSLMDVDQNEDVMFLGSPDIGIENKSSLSATSGVSPKSRTVERLLIVSEDDYVDEISDNCTQLSITDDHINIINPNGYSMLIPSQKIHQFKVGRKDPTCNLIMFSIHPTPKKIKQVNKMIKTIVIQLKNPISLKSATAISRIYNVKLLKFTNVERVQYLPPNFKPIPAAQFTNNPNHTSETTYRNIADKMDTDFSSLRKERRANGSRTRVTYQEMNDNEMDDMMIGENGKSKIYGYIPDFEQLYFEPNLKYEFDNKKKFTITNNEFRCLYNDNWLNDTLLDFITTLHLEKARANNIPKTKNIEIMNSFFFTSLSRPVEDENYYKNVKSWFKKIDDLFDKDYVIIPIMQDLHWYFVVISGLKRLKKRYLKMKNENSTPDAANSDINEEKIKNVDTIEDTLEDKQHDYKEISKANDEDQLTSKDKMSSKEQEILDFDMTNSGDIIPVRNLVSPIRKRRLIDDDTGDFAVDNKPPGAAQISVLNSLRKNHEKAILLLRHFLISYAKDKYDISISPQDIFKKICIVPQQKNLNDCGIHVLYNIEKMLENPYEFDKVILKRPTGHKMRNRAKLENDTFFNKDRLVNYREEMRDMLLELLKKQVESSNGDVSLIGSKTVEQKLYEEHSESKKKKSESTKTDSKSNSTDEKETEPVDKLEDSDDDLVITHFTEKAPLPEPLLSPKKKSTKSKSSSVEKDGDDIDMMDNDSDFSPPSGRATLSKSKVERRSPRRQRGERKSKLVGVPDKPDFSEKVTLATKKSTTDTNNLKSGSTNTDNIVDMSILKASRLPFSKIRKRNKSSELLSQDSFNGGNDDVGLLPSDDEIALVDENKPISLIKDMLNTDTIDEKVDLVASSPVKSTENSAELLMHDIDKEFISQDAGPDHSEKPETAQESESNKSEEPKLSRKYRKSTYERISGSKISAPIEIKDEIEHSPIKINRIRVIHEITPGRGDGMSEDIEMSSMDNNKSVRSESLSDIDNYDSKLESQSYKDVTKFELRTDSSDIDFMRSQSPNLGDETGKDKKEDVVEPADHDKSSGPEGEDMEVTTQDDVMIVETQEDNVEVVKDEDVFDLSAYSKSNELKKLQSYQDPQTPKKKRNLKVNESLPESPKDENIKDAVALYLNKSSAFASPIKLNDELPLRITKVESKLETETIDLSKPANLNLPLHLTRNKKPRQDLKPISATLFSKSKKNTNVPNLPPKPTKEANESRRITRSRSPGLEILSSSEPSTDKLDTIVSDGISRDNKRAGSAYDDSRSNHVDDMNDSLSSGMKRSHATPLTFKKKTRSNYTISDTEHKTHLYEDKYCGSVYSTKPQARKRKRKEYNNSTQDVFTALKHTDDYKVILTDIPDNYDDGNFPTNRSDVEIITSDPEDSRMFESNRHVRDNDEYPVEFYQRNSQNRNNRRSRASGKYT